MDLAHPPTPQEREAFLWMQGRMVELLLRHDAPRFGFTFGERLADPEAARHAWLDRYRSLAVLFYLRNELFDLILPRIERRLSFLSPREVQIEEPPTRGRIDWTRTASAGWTEHPGEVPLAVYTRQRRRHFATPENLLTVVTLIEYRAAAQTMLDAEAGYSAPHALRHPLIDIAEMCTQELVFPQFAGLVQECTAILEGHADVTVEDLEEEVENNLMPGHNTAYDELLAWRKKLRELQLLERTTNMQPQPMLGTDPDRDNYLYQLWIFYELGDLLTVRGVLQNWDHLNMTIHFTWGQDEQQREYVIQHDRAIPNLPAYWSTSVTGIQPPGVRPDFYIQRANPATVQDSQTLIWREPGYVLDAKYYKPRDSIKAPSSPVKRMIADLQLTGEHSGALLFAFQSDAPSAATSADSASLAEEILAAQGPILFGPLYTLTPQPDLAQSIQPDIRIAIWRLKPSISIDSGPVAQALVALLDEAHTKLKDSVEIRCHGVFVDELTATAHGALANTSGLLDRSGAPLASTLDDLLVCPKPHVAPGRVDLVSLSKDCCKNPWLCHIKMQTGVQPPRRLLKLQDLEAALRTASQDSTDVEDVVKVATKQVLALAQRYAELLEPNLLSYHQQVQEKLAIDDLYYTTPLLNDAERDTLALSFFLLEQVKYIHATNFAGPALLLTGVLELATQKSVHAKRPELVTAAGRPLDNTLGTLGNSKVGDRSNFVAMEQAIVGGGYWQDQNPLGYSCTFSDWISTVARIVSIRNDAAHRATAEPKAFQKLTIALFGSPVTGVGALNGLLLSWVPNPQ